MKRWRWVVGFRGLYKVSNTGAVKSVDRQVVGTDGRICCLHGKVLRPKPARYLRVSLCKAPVSFYRDVHVLVCRAFNGPKPTSEHEVNHKNGNKHDNRANNLEWKTHHQNITHSLDTGLAARFPSKTTLERRSRSVAAHWATLSKQQRRERATRKR